MKNRSTGKFPFKVIYWRVPKHTLDLAALLKLPGMSIAAENMADPIMKVHEEVKKVEEFNVKYKEDVISTRS